MIFLMLEFAGKGELYKQLRVFAYMKLSNHAHSKHDSDSTTMGCNDVPSKHGV
jgi:hypothetical protein